MMANSKLKIMHSARDHGLCPTNGTISSFLATDNRPKKTCGRPWLHHTQTLLLFAGNTQKQEHTHVHLGTDTYTYAPQHTPHEKDYHTPLTDRHWVAQTAMTNRHRRTHPDRQRHTPQHRHKWTHARTPPPTHCDTSTPTQHRTYSTVQYICRGGRSANKFR
jgi:hypothetical protein